MDIIESPRRVLANRKKRMSTNSSANANTASISSQSSPGTSFMSPKCVPANWRYDLGGNTPIPMEIDSHPSFSPSARASIRAKTTPLFTWLEQDMPRDILPKILSFAGPRQVLSLSRLNKSWNMICTNEAVFRTMCEDYGKWIEGKDAESNGDPQFWSKVYCDNPIVPLEYQTIRRATESTCKRRQHEGEFYYECNRDIRILMQPGLHILEEEVVVEALGNAQFTVETHTKCAQVGVVEDCEKTTSSSPRLSSSPSQNTQENDPPARTRRRLNSGRAIRNFLSCRSSSGVDNEFHYEIPLKSNYYSGDQATIVLKTAKRNCPIFHIRQGHMKLSNISLVHYCRGTDIWNGNSAVQIQARLDNRHHPIAPKAPHKFASAEIDRSKIMSISGRGIVAIDGSRAVVKNCYIHRCAATGVYIGGAGSVAHMEHTDIVNNGIGNDRSRQGIARGHSGVYLEQGTAVLSNCNISHNALTGLSAVSPDNAILDIQDSELVQNGTLQLELPQEGSFSSSKSVSKNNITSRDRAMRSRSGLQVGDIDEASSGSDSERSL